MIHVVFAPGSYFCLLFFLPLLQPPLSHDAGCELAVLPSTLHLLIFVLQCIFRISLYRSRLGSGFGAVKREGLT
jgi:hypothetical protein